jgi:hypothetical protein
MKESIAIKFNGKYATIDNIVSFVSRGRKPVYRQTVLWNVNELVKQGDAIRVGRGVYGFMAKDVFTPTIGETARQAVALLGDKLKYLTPVMTDTGCLSQFMNLQPFQTVILIEVRKQAVDSVLTALRKTGLEAVLKKDFERIERYVETAEPIVIRPVLKANPPLQYYGSAQYASLEKILVDIVCDRMIFGQYQGDELINIYRNATDRYVVNYSQMLRYASCRKRTGDVEAALLETVEYKKVSKLL